jgi:PAS domain S-box-containing protein
MGPEDVSAEPEKTRGHIAASDAHVPFRWHRKKNGERFAVEITAAQIIHLGRRTALVSLRDVTARLRAEEAVQASETRYRRLFEAAKDGVLILDVKTGKVVDVNPFLVELLGFSHQEFLGKTVWELGFFKDIIANQDKFEELQQQEYVRYENLPLETKDGRRIQVEFISNVYRVNHHKVIQCNIRDVTARQQAEAALRFERDLWQTLLDTSPDHIYFKDTQSRFIKSSKAQARQFGVASPDELVGKTDFDFFTDEHARPAYEDEQEIIRTGVPIIAKEEREVWTDGRVSWTSSTKMPMHDATGKIIGIMGISRDITERKLAEEQLRQLSSAVEHSPASIVITDPAGNIEYVNPKFTEVSGYSLTEVLGKNPRVLKSGETPRAEYQHMWQTIKSGGEWQGEFHNRKKDGGLFWESASISSILDGSGKIAHFVAVKEDITEVKLAREKLRQRESFLSAITENQPGLLWLKDVEGRFLTVNRAFAAACGRSDPEQVHGLTDLDIWPKELGEKYRHDDKRVMATGKACIVEEMIFMENTHVWHETFKTPVRDDQGRVIGTTGYARDITERRRAEEQLTEAFNFNQKIISDAAVGIVVFKASGQCVLANETAAQALGATVSRILEQDFRHIASWRDSGMLQTAKESLAMKEPRQCESHVVTAFGKEVWLVCHFSHFVQNGESHLLLIFNDVTEKKRLEAQFLRSQRMESIGTLAGGIAHDLNNVLTPLLFSVQILKEKVFDDEGQQILDTLETNVRRGASLVKQVLAFGRGVKSDRVLLQVKNIAREIEHIVQETFPKSVQFRLEAATDIWTVSCDPTQIHQVLLNLCVNARDAMPDGGKLSLRLNNIMVDAAHAAMNLDARPGPYVVISVEDTGTGISRENQERIFEPFFTTKDPGKGTGLGLSTTLAIVKSHGGFIHCYSEPGKGSTFKVYLPADDKSAAMESAPTEQLQLPRGNGELVLVVDDEAPIREIARQMLERFGYRVLLAVNGAEAVQLYTSRQNEIAVVITDMAMPVMDGHATIAALQAINPKVKVIGSSGLDMNDGATRAVNDAIRHFIPKPYTAESMLNILDEALRENPAKRQTGKTKLPPNGPAN